MGMCPPRLAVMSTTKTFADRVEAFLRETGLPPTALGKLSVNDGHLVRNLRAGRDFRASTIDRVTAFMRDYRAKRLRIRSRRRDTRAAA